jgi:hypothetical protein
MNWLDTHFIPLIIDVEKRGRTEFPSNMGVSFIQTRAFL